MTTTKRAAIEAAMSVADDVAAGRLPPADLDQTLATECRALVGNVVGPSDPLWSVQVDIARGVLAAGGIPPGELTEWLAVARRLAESDPAPADAAPPDADQPVSKLCSWLFLARARQRCDQHKQP